jgi:phospho-N-acetylmuramoyl-pentapeptide-transferase
MLYHLLYPLRDLFGPFNLFRYITFRAAYAAALAIVLVIGLGPWFTRRLKKAGIVAKIRDEVPGRHKGKTGTPMMGGVLILFSLIVSTLLFADLTNRYIQLGLGGLLGLGALGAWDDYLKFKGRPRGLSIGTKLAGQIGLGLVIGSILYFLPLEPSYRTQTNLLLFKNFLLNLGVGYIPFVVLVVVGTSNAVNLTDGLDGLSVGILGICLAAYAALSYLAGHIKFADYLDILYVRGAGELTVLCAAALGACLGFLWFNSYPATIFMGDTGALALGGLVGIAAVICKHELLLLLVGGVFVIEALSVLAQIVYFHSTNHRRLLRMAPLHHHFELSGWPEPKIVVRFWILGILFALLALSSLKIR